MVNKCLKMERLDKCDEGNTITKPRRSKLAKYWAFTYFSEKELLDTKVEQNVQNIDNIFKVLKEMLMPSSDKGIIGYEICPSSGRPHFQGFVAFKKRIRANERFKNGFHWENCKGSESDNEKYCSKDGNYVKWGVFKSDFLINKGDLNSEQINLCKLFEQDCNPKFDRSIHYYWESVGGWGKSLVSTYMVDQMGALLLNGAKNNMFFAITKYIETGKYPRIIIIDLPREQQNNFNVLAIESIKNGMFFNEKYESGMCRFPRPHVVVFSNYPPDRSRMSLDRWVVTSLRGESEDLQDIDA